MADAIYYVARTQHGVSSDKNLVREVFIFNDDGDSEAVVIQNTVDALNTANPVEAGAEDVYPAGYFQTAIQCGASPADIFDSEFDFKAYGPSVSDLETP